jgi:hypothetical protein
MNRLSGIAFTLLASFGLLTVPRSHALESAAAPGTAVAPLTLPLAVASLINHTGISVPDVTASALFYSKLFGGDKVGGEMIPMPNGQPPSTRYFLLVDSANVAIGLLGTLGSTAVSYTHLTLPTM